MNTRICIICKKRKKLSDFNKGKYKNYIRKNGEISKYFYSQNRCRKCGKRLFKEWYEKRMKESIWRKKWSEKTRTWIRKNPERAKQISKKINLELRISALNAYSNNNPKCKCCGESIIEFLAIDHVNNNGAEHRRRIKKQLHRWLRDNNYPKGFQVLCHNCNIAKAFYKICPHQINILENKDE